jgi:transcriptional regulator with XRE-family HTH domain
MVTRIEIGTELIAGDSAIDGALNLKHALGRNLLLFPLGNCVRGNTEEFREFSLRSDNIEHGLKGSVVHMQNYIHRRLSGINRHLIGGHQPTEENKQMVDTPRPEHFSEFKDWLEAVRRQRNVDKADVASIGGASPQAATKWFKGGNVNPDALQKLADWAGFEYIELRALLEKKPLPGSKAKKGIKQPSADAQRIARKVDLLTDDSSLTAVEALIDTLLSKTVKDRRHK